ncbi:MAG: hypothetical protein M3R02_15140 [Chloroflexota bacterium]|nr:hypothetical protein [Chloroflexota bacterium]
MAAVRLTKRYEVDGVIYGSDAGPGLFTVDDPATAAVLTALQADEDKAIVQRVKAVLAAEWGTASGEATKRSKARRWNGSRPEPTRDAAATR